MCDYDDTKVWLDLELPFSLIFATIVHTLSNFGCLLPVIMWDYFSSGLVTSVQVGDLTKKTSHES